MSAETLGSRTERATSQFQLECIKRRATITEWRGRSSTVPEWDPGGESINRAIVACKTDLGISIGSLGDVYDGSWNSLSGPEIINKILDAIEAIGAEELVKSQGILPDGDEKIIAEGAEGLAGPEGQEVIRGVVEAPLGRSALGGSGIDATEAKAESFALAA